MRKLQFILLSLFALSLFSCNSADDQLQEILRENLETSKGVRTDLQIKFTKFDVVDILVKDSVAYYKTQFDNEKKNRVSALETKIAYHQKEVAELESKANRDIVDNMLLSDQRSLLKTATESLQSLDGWTPSYLTTYQGRNENEVLAKLATVSFSFVNLKGVKQEVTEEKFLFSGDATKVLEQFVGRGY